MTDASLSAGSPAPAPLSVDAARPVKLLAMDAEDLAVLSAFAQDAIAKPVEMRRLGRERAFVMVVDRLAREQGAERAGLLGRRRVWQRRRAALDFRTVSAVRRRGFAGPDDGPMVLLAITHEPGPAAELAPTPDEADAKRGGAAPNGAGAPIDGAGAAPGGAGGDTITLHFAGGAELRLDVEAIEARLTDLGPAWESDNTPRHR